MVRPGWLILMCSLMAVGQSAPSAPNVTPAKAAAPASAAAAGTKTNAASKSVKAESVTINMPEGLTKDQADAILTELKAIHQLLQTQQNTRAAAAPAPAAPPAPSDKVKMSVGTGWY